MVTYSYDQTLHTVSKKFNYHYSCKSRTYLNRYYYFSVFLLEFLGANVVLIEQSHVIMMDESSRVMFRVNAILSFSIFSITEAQVPGSEVIWRFSSTLLQWHDGIILYMPWARSQESSVNWLLIYGWCILCMKGLIVKHWFCLVYRMRASQMVIWKVEYIEIWWCVVIEKLVKKKKVMAQCLSSRSRQ